MEHMGEEKDIFSYSLEKRWNFSEVLEPRRIVIQRELR
jgi:hypothetical protein